jgi:iron complex outermembrane receptor protein
MNLRTPRRRRLTACIVCVLAGGLGLSVQAQEEAAEEAKALDAVIVTAQKREETLQSVPITMNVLSEQALQQAGVRDIKDMQVLVPGLSVTSTSAENQTTARLRGVGTVGDNPGLESSVGIVIDGIYRPRNGVGFGDLGELERVEVLKGPQGTLFGKNTSAGLISIVTRKPEFRQEVGGELTAGNYGALGAAGSYNDVLGEDAAFRLYAVKRKRDGFMDVETANGPRTFDEDGDQDMHGLRAQLAWLPNEDLDIQFSTDYARRDENCCVSVTRIRGATAAAVNAFAGGPGVIDVADPERRLAFANRPSTSEIEDRGMALELNWRSPWFGGATLTSITGWRDWSSDVASDLDYSGADIWYRPAGPAAETLFQTFSQELRLSGEGERTRWLLGLFHADEDMRYGFPIDMGGAYEGYLSTLLISNIANSLAPAGINVSTANGFAFLSEAAGRPYGTTFVGPTQRDSFDQSAKSNALFGNFSFDATDALELSLGLRYTQERKQLDSNYSTPNGALGCAAALGNPSRVGAALVARGVPASVVGQLVPTVIGNMCLPWSNPLFNGVSSRQDRDEKEWSGSLKASYQFADGLMGYASAARGYKAGGFNQDRELSPTLTPDLDTAFEGEFVDAFELGIKSTWLDGNLLLNGALFHQTYTDFQLNSFIGTSFVVRSIPELVSQGADLELQWQASEGLLVQAGATWLDSKYGNDPLPDAALSLLPGNTASFAPRWSITSSLQYEHGLGALQANWYLGARYMSEYNTGSDLLPTKLQEAYTLLNARFGIGPANGRWSLELWGQNLTDKTYTQVAFNAPLQSGSINDFLGAPRTWGLTLRLRY